MTDSASISALLAQRGGLSELFSQFLTQFFALEKIGALTTALLCCVASCSLWKVMRIFCGSWAIFPLAWLPAVMMGVTLASENSHYSGLASMTLMLVLLGLYIELTLRCSKRLYSLVAGIVIAVSLYFLLGSVAMLFAISAATFAIVKDKKRGWLSLVLPLAVALTAFVSISRGDVAGWADAIWGKDYRDYYVETDLLFSLSWIAVPFVIILSRLTAFLSPAKAIWREIALFAVFTALACWVYADQTKQRTDDDLLTLKEFMHYAINEEWEKITSSDHINPKNLLHLNMVNLALARQGKLLDRLFVYPQVPGRSLMASLQSFRTVTDIFSKIYYTMGVVSEAQNLAFSTNVGTDYGSPEMMKMIVKTKLITGQYAVAEKFISALEKTTRYADWAASYRKFLYDDVAVEEDSELGLKRRDLPSYNGFGRIYGTFSDVFDVFIAGAADKDNIEYLFAYLLLDKNEAAVRDIVEHDFGTPALPELPERVQEAVMGYSELDLDYCRAHGVTEKVIKKYNTYKKLFLESRQGNKQAAKQLSNYKDTYWYYLMFTK